MRKLYYGTRNKEGYIPGNVIEEGELISSVLIPSDNLSEMEKPGEIEIKKETEDDLLKDASEIDPSEYLVKRWDNGKAKRIYSGLIGSIEDDWKDVDSLEVYGDGKIYADGEEIKGEFTITYGSKVLIKDVQDITRRTDEEMENEYFHCIYCDKEVKSYKAIENTVPDDWIVNPKDDEKKDSLERMEDGSMVLKGICPECAEKEDLSE